MANSTTLSEIKSYSDIEGLGSWLIKQLKHLKIEIPTPVQLNCIPPALCGKDVIGAAKTGSGKTLAFVLPILQKLSAEPHRKYALILTPTRELAFQISDQFKVVGTPISLQVTTIIGGLPKVDQGVELSRNPHIIVSTPGRLADIINTSPEFSLKRIKFLVIDEADRLMDGRFDDQLKVIWGALPTERQTLVFSATMTDRVKRMKELATSNIFSWESTEDNMQVTVEQLDEKYAVTSSIVKDASLVAVLTKYREDKPRDLVIIFTDTCKNTQLLKMMLNELGIESICLHSMLMQKERLAALTMFKSSRVKYLIATDLASRGLDIPAVSLVINHCIPNIPKTYIHRVGRTARAGRSGTALTLVLPSELRLLMAIEGATKRKMTEYQIDDNLVKKILKEVNVTKREQNIKLDQTDFDERRTIHKRKRLILEGIDPEEFEREKQQKKKNRKKR